MCKRYMSFLYVGYKTFSTNPLPYDEFPTL
jgi:hypothetical protein